MFIQVMQGHTHRPQEIQQLGERWLSEIGPGAVGYLGSTHGVTDDGTYVGVVRFDSREHATANAGRPEQGRWWAEFERCFDGPVEFHDCDDVVTFLDGGSDRAGFVQVIEGKVEDPERLKAALADMADVASARPDIIGGTLAIDADGNFFETVAFTDEASARRGEQQRLPEPAQRPWESLVSNVAFLDLHQPMFMAPR